MLQPPLESAVCGRLLGGVLAHPPARGQANTVLDEGFLRVGVNPRVDRLMADRTVSVGGSIHGRQCATRFGVQAPADLARCVPLGQIGNHATAQDLITIQ